MSPDVPNRSRPPASPSPVLTVVIVNYDGWPDVLRLVAVAGRGRPRSRSGRCEVVVVDNASPGPIPAEMTVAPPRGPPRLPTRQRRVRRRRQRRLAGLEEPLAARAQPRRGRPAPACSGRSSPGSSSFEDDPEEAPGVVGFGLRNPDGTRQPSVGAFPSLARTVWEQLIPRSRRKYQAGWRTRPGPGRLGHGRLRAGQRGHCSRPRAGWTRISSSITRRSPSAGPPGGSGWRVEYDPSVEVVHLRPLQNRAILAQDAGHHPAQQAALFPQALAPLAVRGALVDRLGRGADAGGLVRGPGMGRGRPGVADDRRGGEAAAARGWSCEDATCWCWRTGRDGDGRVPRGPGLPRRGRIGKEAPRGATDRAPQPRKDGPSCRRCNMRPASPC